MRGLGRAWPGHRAWSKGPAWGPDILKTATADGAAVDPDEMAKIVSGDDDDDDDDDDDAISLLSSFWIDAKAMLQWRLAMDEAIITLRLVVELLLLTRRNAATFGARRIELVVTARKQDSIQR